MSTTASEPFSGERCRGITIAVPTYNRRHILERTICVYRELATRHPLIFIDDGSDDGTATWLATQGLRVIRHSRRRGLPAARNTALRACTTAWIFFGEDDVVLTSDHPLRLLRWAQAHPHAAAIAGRLHSSSEWQLPGQEPESACTQALIASSLTADFSASIARPTPLPSLHACALIDRQAALAVGGYDTRYTDSAFREESDFYARLWRSGRSCWLVPDAWAIHVRHRLGGGARGGRSIAERITNRWSYLRNDVRYLQRHAHLWRHWLGHPPATGRLCAASGWRLLGNILKQMRRP